MLSQVFHLNWLLLRVGQENRMGCFFSESLKNLVMELLICGVKYTGREWYNVVLYPLKQLKLLLVAGHVTTTDNRCFVLPMSTNDSLSPSQIQTVTDAVKAVSSTARSVHLVYYHEMPANKTNV